MNNSKVSLGFTKLPTIWNLKSAAKVDYIFISNTLIQ